MFKRNTFVLLSIFIFLLSWPVKSIANNDFVFPQSHVKKLSEDVFFNPEVYNKLSIARNEIFARHGHIFENRELRSYFLSKKWYKPIKKVSFDELNSIEKYNVILISYFEKYYYKSKLFIEKNYKDKIPFFPANKEVHYDLNNDGISESIIYKPSNKGFTLQVNNQSITNELYTNLQKNFAIVDIYKSDNYKEIVIFDEGPSNDYTSIFYQFYNNKIIEIGSVGGIYNIGLHVYGNGIVEGLIRAKLLQTWYFNQRYILKNHKLEPIHQDIYKTNFYVFVKKDIKLHTTRSEKSRCFTLKQGQIINIVGCDNKKWCLIETSTGKKGWLLLKNFSFLVDNNMDARDALIGLCYAD
ncbi:YARHG domain-containing protein [Anaerocellum danielii]|uniref:YARHG domain-containing protein n=1 Tax=Anaerocellum danielii TaxID=1387557 RepID=A0ABZ0U1P8_9FIRM|nr:YARHG domain-containing protein [Caldicellulosiruptor danielii]WPX09638.1 YARHG domain-containing protein [Caldicellulosiruptor danielii]